MRTALLAVAIAALGGCNALFGLDPTHAADDDGGPGTIDGSTIDGAPCVNAGTHDEDGDGIADECDLCPHIAALAGETGDSDGDGVGDACDPGPGPDHLVLFDPLEPAGADWHLVFGVWFNDSFGFKVVDASADALAYTTTSLPEGGTVDVGIHLDALGTPTGGAVSLWYRASLAGDPLEGYTCRIANTGAGNTQLTLTASQSGTAVNLGTQDLDAAYATGQRIRLRGYHDWNGGTLRCDSYQAGNAGHLTAENTSFAGGQIGVGATGTALTVEYLWITAPGDG